MKPGRVIAVAAVSLAVATRFGPSHASAQAQQIARADVTFTATSRRSCSAAARTAIVPDGVAPMSLVTYQEARRTRARSRPAPSIGRIRA
jgi:hypothetical protein